MQADGDLVLLKSGAEKLWASGTAGKGATHAEMRAGGNLALVGSRKVVWQTKTNGHRGARLVVQDDGNLVVYGADQSVVWQSGTVTEWAAATGDRLRNDGLNTVIPYADPKYRELRPGHRRGARAHAAARRAGRPAREARAADGSRGRASDLAIVQGVGYPYPNRSHFRSIEIWDTASASNQTLSEGWIAQAFEGTSLPRGAGRRQHRRSTPMRCPAPGPELRTIVMQDAENFLRQAKALKDTAGMKDGGNPALRHLLAVRQEVNAARPRA